ncbi:MCE family protein [Gordonia pseudamarae]|uniref:MCE family protein n=1 Tax=Gordonia pseudamarae TaxID=2831662 RepID=A0ABX6IMD5_9ACTN|nr:MULTISPECIES: MCE family protein [Gordonia]MBD0021258.1 MCE family protein [Gordonia sp. (in: high G+C Gram-positive bacteria)]QHN27619.1 MCE family protein [Gordonia pseudamarae]QHN36501.1 MCE family protein [Gordonia pseudamarae]
MISKLAKIQLIAFAIVGIVAVVYAGAKYARLDKLSGLGQYDVTVQMAESSGGIFKNAEVTYQGTPVGTVGDLKLTKDGVDVILNLNKSAPKVPASASAVIANRSAVGEQFIDLQPTSSAGPFLKDGSVIPRERTSIPPPVENILNSAIKFTEEVPIDDFHTVVTELGEAFNRQSENLERLVDSLGVLAKAGVDSLPETISLIENSNVVLGTQAEQKDEILSWARNLDVVTETLKSSDPDIRRVLKNGPSAGTELSELFRKHGGDLTKVMKDLGTTMRTIGPTGYATNTIFAMLSALSSGSKSVVPGDGQIHFGIVLETNNPPACTKGYESTQKIIEEMKKRNPDFDINYDEFPFNTQAECKVPVGNPTGVRSAARADLANPTIPQPWDNTPKKDPDKLNLNPIATQLAGLLGIHAK